MLLAAAEPRPRFVFTSSGSKIRVSLFEVDEKRYNGCSALILLISERFKVSSDSINRRANNAVLDIASLITSSHFF
jgi:hypothetical protein